jgi:glutamate racemase
VKICNVLLERNCKLILIACNSASAAAYDLVNLYVGSKALVVNVIDPVVNYLREYYAGKAVGLIGTRQTILSGAYEEKIKRLNQPVLLQSLATPLLAPMIEEGFYREQISKLVIAEYLNKEELANLEALVLGCTHYPLIKPAIEAYYREHNRNRGPIGKSPFATL